MAEPAIRVLPPVLSPSSSVESSWLTVLPPASRLVIHGDAGARAAISGVMNIAFSEEACRAVSRGERTTLWLGPDEFLLVGPTADSDPDSLAALHQSLEGIACAVVDVSHRQFALQISGVHASTILSAACPLDLDGLEFPVGMCTRTVFAKADILLWRTGPDSFRIEIWRSFAGYVVGLLREIAREFQPAT